MRQIGYFLLLSLIILGALFAYINPEIVTVNYYLDSIELPMGFFAFGFFIAGFLMGLFFTIKVFIKLKRDNYRLKSEIRLASKELDNLRSMPITDSH